MEYAIIDCDKLEPGKWYLINLGFDANDKRFAIHGKFRRRVLGGGLFTHVFQEMFIENTTSNLWSNSPEDEIFYSKDWYTYFEPEFRQMFLRAEERMNTLYNGNTLKNELIKKTNVQAYYE